MSTDSAQPEWLRNLRRDMRLKVRDMVGTGYVREYYEQLAEPFVTMASEYIKDAARHPDVYLDAKPAEVLTALSERMVDAQADLQALITIRAVSEGDPVDIIRLSGKAEGVRLALSYVDETLRMTQPTEETQR